MHGNSNFIGTRMRIQKSGLIQAAAFALATAFMGMASGGCDKSTEAEAEAVPTAKFVSPLNGSTVAGPNVLVKVATTNFSFSAGHIHIYQDRPIGEDADAVFQMTKYDTVTLSGFTPGKHYLIIQGANEKHVDVESMVDSVMFTVTAP